MTEKLRWGIMAPGEISEEFLSDARLAEISIEAVGSRSLDRAKAYSTKHGIDRYYGSYQELADDPQIDVIYISSPHSAHFENASMALRGSKHVLLEKPFTLNANQAKSLVDLARSEGKFLMEAMWTRFLPNHREIFSKIKEGFIGEPLYLLADHNQYLPEDIVPRLHNPALGGGALIDLGVYPISLAHRLFGKPTRISASAVLFNGSIDESVATIFEYSQGRQALTHSSLRVSGPMRAYILGSEGRIELDRSFYTHSNFTIFDQKDQVRYRYEGNIEGRGMQYQALEVERCIHAGLLESPIMTLNETVEIMEVMDEVRAQTGIEYPGV